MEAASVRPPRPLQPQTPAIGAIAQKGFTGPLKRVLHTAGDLGTFSLRAMWEVPRSFRYFAEILRQIAFLVTGSALVIWFMTFIIGTMCATEAVYTLRGYGATAYAGSFTVLCGTRVMAPYMFCYIFAAKVGAGWVAEIGSMRTSDEIDALETSGINPMRFLIGTRLAAAWIALPCLIIVGLGFTTRGHFVVVVLQLGDISQGGWEQVHWALQSPLDILFALIKTMFMATVILLVAMYYGYRATGGPVGVGNATANTMIYNMVVLNITATTMTMLFWGLDARLPIGG
jgi:phospholipid/cholesterol/gamma-HCH transport system permease protein